ncbi:unnamed protein product, partial [Didymodactylos carnosus]
MANSSSLRTINELLSCPITCVIFHDPVLADDGRTYEREAIEKWIVQSGTSPITRQPLNIQTIRPNHVVKALVDEFETTMKKKNYQFKLDVDVRKASRQPLFSAYGKYVYKAEWLIKNNGPQIILMKINGARAEEEAKFYVELTQHRHIVRTFGFVEDNPQKSADTNNSIMLLQEYAPEGNLFEFLQDQDSLPKETVLCEIFAQIADAMAFLAQKDIVHGDLACRNVLVFRFDKNDPRFNIVKLTDFGLSR